MTVDKNGDGLSRCGCVPSCQPPPQPTDGSGVIDIRIVSTPPDGVTCAPTYAYCCYVTPATTTPPPPTCGTRTPMRLANIQLKPGQSMFGEFPWSAIVLGRNNEYIGGGVLVGSFHVLTAAHKIASSLNCPYLKVRLGEWDTHRNIEPYSYKEYGFSRVRIHPQYNSKNLQNDIALITLTNGVPLGTYPNIVPACMTGQNAAFTGQRCYVSGWGKDSFGSNGQYQYIEKKANVPVLSYSDCQAKLQTTRLGAQFKLDPSSFICAGGEPGYDACTGDGGAPLVCEVNGQFYLAGLVAWGIGCAGKGVPGVYVNVPNYRNWINQQIASEK
ncbi:hypothetical protein C0J52_16417 [Blattella germanica]|nr:hypothetical protein C0J52_16417 [Blattella germanica]